MSTDERMIATANTDREIWRAPDGGCGDYYADSIHLTQDGGIGFNCGGRVIVMPPRKWHDLAAAALRAPEAADAGAVAGAVNDESYAYVQFSGPGVDALDRRKESDNGPTEGQVTRDARAFVEREHGFCEWLKGFLKPDGDLSAFDVETIRGELAALSQRPNTGGEDKPTGSARFGSARFQP